MLGKIAVEILILWALYALYMAILVHRRGPIGAIFFYSKGMQDRVIELGLITEGELRRRRAFAYWLLLAMLILVPMVMILFINGARRYWDCCWQFFALFMGAELFDWLVIDTLWVALSDWWLIPGTEDLNDTWHNTRVKRWKLVKLIPVGAAAAAVFGGLYWLIGKLL